MSKRQQKFERRERDFYATPYEAVVPLLPHLAEGMTFCEPCAGDGALIRHLGQHGYLCLYASDIRPMEGNIVRENALNAVAYHDIDCFITNPPWSRDILHPLIEHLSGQAPTWLLFDADWMHTKQSSPYMQRCSKIVSVGRVSWMGNGVSGFDNCCWYLFGSEPCDTLFYGR